MESQNAELIKEGLPQSERFAKLHKMARTQMQILLKNRTKEKLKMSIPICSKGQLSNKNTVTFLSKIMTAFF